MSLKSPNFVSLLIWQCQADKPALPFKFNEGLQYAMRALGTNQLRKHMKMHINESEEFKDKRVNDVIKSKNYFKKRGNKYIGLKPSSQKKIVI